MEAIIELIAEQKMILLSIGLALMPLVLATLLMMVDVLLSIRAQLKRRWAARRAAHAEAARLAADGESLLLDDEEDIANAASTAIAIPSTTIKAKTMTVPAVSPENAVSSMSSGMNDLLASVFIDEEALARYEVLVKGIEPIETQALVKLCRSVLHEAYQLYPAGTPKPEATA